MRPLFFAALVIVVASSESACSRETSTEAPAAARSAALPLAAGTLSNEAISGAAAAPVIDFIGGFDECTLSHRGVLLDLGDPTMRARMSGTKLTPPDVEVREHEGASWVSLHERSLSLSFVSPTGLAGEGGVVVQARMRGGTAKSISVFLDGKGVGALPLTKGEIKVVSLHVPGVSIARGANELLLRVNGGGRATHDDLAEIDWIRVGTPDGDAPYAAPTRTDALTTVAIGGVMRRGISLRAPGSARCPGVVPSGAMLEGQIGVSGGEAEADVRLLVDRAEPRVIGSFRLGGEGAPAWQPISLPLGGTGTLAAIELVAKSSTKGARIVFAEPRVVVPAAPVAARAPVLPAAPASRGVIIVVLGSVAPALLSPYGGSAATTALAQLADTGAVFEAHRATSSFANGSVASILTGLLPAAHGVAAPEASLAEGALTLAEAARQGGVVTAMFTANPTTGALFGFGRGWETFTSRAPVGDAPATAIFEDVERWLEGHKDDRFLVLVHARGGHPPWDVTSSALKDLAPAGYAGSLDPKHAGEMLAKVRKNGASRFFTDADRERAFALHATAVLEHDAALGKLVARVRALGREADTTWIVTGDVGIDLSAHAPFLEDDTLDENALAIPLVMRGPGRPAHARVSSPTANVDLARTALESLGLAKPPQLRGESLWSIAQRGARGAERPRVATTAARFSERWAGFVLTGAGDREIKLCNLSLEADCVSDVRATHPLAAELLHARLFAELGRAGPGLPPNGGASTSGSATAPVVPRAVRAVPDAQTAAALRAWGIVSTPAAGK